MINIAIDGPSGSGKSTVSDIVANKLNILHLNTGALYRAVGLYLIEHNIDPNNERDVLSCIDQVRIELKYIDGIQRVYLEGVDVTDRLYSLKVSDVCSISSAYPKVRELITSIQRQVAETVDVVMEGRDITSVVLPNAKYKFYLDASARIRAIRRINDTKNQDHLNMDDLARVEAEIIERDRRDQTRETSPLIRTADSIYINSDNITAQEVSNIIINKVKEGEK